MIDRSNYAKEIASNYINFIIVEMRYTGWQNEKDGGEEKVKRQRQRKQ